MEKYFIKIYQIMKTNKKNFVLDLDINRVNKLCKEGVSTFFFIASRFF